MKLHDVVRLINSHPSGLERGSEGAVVEVFPGPPPAYEVEFVASNGQTIALITLHESELELVPRPQ